MKFASFFLIALSLALTFSSSANDRRSDIERSKLMREPGALYLEDLTPKPKNRIELIILEPAQAYGDTKAQRQLGVFPRNRVVELIAVSEFAYKVRGQARNGRLAGWVSKKLVGSKDKDLETKLNAVIKRHQLVEELIAKRQIAIGMTPEEVSRVLGTPTRRESKLTTKGQQSAWEYITYDTITHFEYLRDPRTGQTYKRAVSTEKVETGKVRVEFTDGVATAISETEDDPAAGGVKIIPVPFIW
ncbi:hypothetical protein [Sulfuriroseicoccus oceanibius]|uniref:Uncharacterized protein n=1 Tax=Sulfuriroseicoccus oceanibius TaxID=2707525 RepID=A0A6B3L358_9BACT|nr:hypothetical protein [Sulfuriroseicoccus oceanibius]QQL45275.1 hypothetical protein G3M56_001425 [Sulfuriroseicoccus oceanibius]